MFPFCRDVLCIHVVIDSTRLYTGVESVHALLAEVVIWLYVLLGRTVSVACRGVVWRAVL